MTRVAFLLFSLLLAQAPTTNRPSIEGRLERRGTTDPVVGAVVELAKIGGPLTDYRSVTSDASGRFAFKDLAPGDYRLYAERQGYLRVEYGQRWTELGKLPIALGAGQNMTNVLVTMTPTGVIAGRIRDNDGNPLRNVWVRAMTEEYSRGERGLTPVGFAQTNDLGEYRIFGLPPGAYFVSATLNRPYIEGETYVFPDLRISTSDRGYQFKTRVPGETALALGIVDSAAFNRDLYFTIYYPNTISASNAMAVELGPGATLPGIDLMMAAGRTVHIRGRVINGATGEAIRNTTVLIKPELGGNTRTLESGAFDIPGVPPGVYELWTYGGPGGYTLFGGARVTVADKDIDGVTIIQKPDVTITGRLTTEGRGASTNETFNVQLLSPPDRALRSGVRVQPDGTFSIADIVPGNYGLRVYLMPSGRDAYIKNARFGSANVLNAPLQIEQGGREERLNITVSLNTADLDILVVDANRQPLSGIPVVAVPEPSRINAQYLGISDANGRIHKEGFLPGSYLFFASGEIGFQQWRNPSVVRMYEKRGTLAQIKEGAKESLVLSAINQ